MYHIQDLRSKLLLSNAQNSRMQDMITSLSKDKDESSFVNAGNQTDEQIDLRQNFEEVPYSNVDDEINLDEVKRQNGLKTNSFENESIEDN
jgi:hypothetical protein